MKQATTNIGWSHLIPDTAISTGRAVQVKGCSSSPSTAVQQQCKPNEQGRKWGSYLHRDGGRLQVLAQVPAHCPVPTPCVEAPLVLELNLRVDQVHDVNQSAGKIS
jgi:hypothetical protein